MSLMICSQQTDQYTDSDGGIVGHADSNSDDVIKYADDHEESDEESDEEPECLNTVEELARGIIKTRMNEFREYTILLVGETGTGKTTFLSLLANILFGRNPGEYDADLIHEKDNESGEGERHSQTMTAKHYLFESKNGVAVCVLDTPGFADTRGVENDKGHKTSIVKVIQDHIPVLNAVLIVANGTVPRLGAATDYALSTLSSIFPRSLEANIGILFTNVDDPACCNFDQESLPESLRDNRQFFVNNPLAKWKKSESIDKKKKKKERARMKGTVEEAHRKALRELVLLFDWLDTLEPQSTKEILYMHEKSQEIDRNINSFSASARQSASKKARLQTVLKEADNTKSTMKKYQDYRDVVFEQVWELSKTKEMKTTCLHPDCYSNCPINRPELEKMHRSKVSTWEKSWSQNIPIAVKRPAALLLSGYFSIHNSLFLPDCPGPRCKHPYHYHTHDLVEWRKDHHSIVIDNDAEEKYSDAKDKNEKLKALKDTIQKAIDKLDEEIKNCLTRLALLTEEYSKLSLSGSFAGQVRKTVVLLELNLESMRNKGDSESVRKVEESLVRMKEMLSILEKARAKVREQIVRLPEPHQPLLLLPN